MSDKLAMILAYGTEDLAWFFVLRWGDADMAFREAYWEACRRDEQAAASLEADFQA